MSFAVGAEVEFERYPSSWYRATVTAANDTECQIHLHGFGWSDWTPVSKLRPAPDTPPADVSQLPDPGLGGGADEDDDARVNELYQRHEQMATRVSYAGGTAIDDDQVAGRSASNLGGSDKSTDLARRILALETRCQLEASARASIEKELKAQKEMHKNSATALTKLRQELGERKGDISEIHAKIDEELAPMHKALEQQESDINDQREALSCIMDTMEDAVTLESLTKGLAEHEASMEKKMTEYWNREMDGIVMDAELDSVRASIKETTDALLEHVNNIEAQLIEEQAGDSERLDALETSLEDACKTIAENEAKAESSLEEAKEDLFNNIDQLSEDLAALKSQHTEADGKLSDLTEGMQAMDTKVEGFDCRLHARMDSEMRYMKEKVDQGMQLLVTRIDGEVKVINDRTEHVRQATSCLDDALCRLDAKLDATVSALDKQINQLAQALDDQLSSVVDQVDGSLVELHSRLDSFTKEVQQFVVESALEKEVGRAAMTSLNNKIDAVLGKLTDDIVACGAAGKGFTSEQCALVSDRADGKFKSQEVRLTEQIKVVGEDLWKTVGEQKEFTTEEIKKLSQSAVGMQRSLEKMEKDVVSALTKAIGQLEGKLTELTAKSEEQNKRNGDNMEDVRQKVLSQDKRLQKTEFKVKEEIPLTLQQLHGEFVSSFADFDEKLDESLGTLKKQISEDVVGKLRKQGTRLNEITDSVKKVDERCTKGNSYTKTISIMVDEVTDKCDGLSTLVMDMDEKMMSTTDAVSELEIDFTLLKCENKIAGEDAEEQKNA